MIDDTEEIRRILVSEINHYPQPRAALQRAHGRVWDTAELIRDFEVKGFAAPFVVVVRRSDGVVGSLTFQHAPRFYFAFQPD
jgi:hypothetical protein